ncbi:hypothetical protein [uncultured Brevundimonas sp.]|uniref:hypothetical protein n=1 Tax=uncultured Brevundimonas sp. TaxID=213418 RepID=UPI0030EEE14A|tara:strand:+ start:94 stop:966 length:873 start_codon:yes stop_codon:yes gene_type:complete
MTRAVVDRLRTRSALIVQALVTAVVSLVAIRVAGGAVPAITVQAASLGLGALLAAAFAFTSWRPGRIGTPAILALSLIALLATLNGSAGGEVSRWLVLGPVMIQPASILLPLVVWMMAERTADWMAGGLTAALALMLAVQPDAASATGLLLALVGIVVARRRLSSPEGAAILCAFGACVWAWTRVDLLPAVPTVERIVVTALVAQPAVGVLAGLLLVLLPLPFAVRAFAGVHPKSVTAIALFGLWIGLVGANFVGNYPAPVIGYGASLVLGWLMSLGIVARRQLAQAIPS